MKKTQFAIMLTHWHITEMP